MNRYYEELAYHFGCDTHDPRIEPQPEPQVEAPDEYIFDDMDADEAEELVEDEP